MTYFIFLMRFVRKLGHITFSRASETFSLIVFLKSLCSIVQKRHLTHIIL